MVLPALALLLVTANAQAAVVGIDARNGFNAQRILATGSMFETFRATIESRGHTIVPLLAFTSDELEGLDALILAQPSVGDGISSNYSAAEIAAVHAFVANGGGLLVHGEGGGFSNGSTGNLNALVAPYGVIYASAATAASGLTVAPRAYVSYHKVIHEIDEPIGLDFVRPLNTIAAPAVNIFAGDDPVEQYVAVVDADGTPSGNVVMLSDESLWTDPGEGSDTDIEQFYPTGGDPFPVDNLQLLVNIIDFIAGGPLPGDVTGDGKVDVEDLMELFKSWGVCPDPPEPCTGDLNGDGVVDALDLLMLLGLWGVG